MNLFRIIISSVIVLAFVSWTFGEEPGTGTKAGKRGKSGKHNKPGATTPSRQAPKHSTKTPTPASTASDSDKSSSAALANEPMDSFWLIEAVTNAPPEGASTNIVATLTIATPDKRVVRSVSITPSTTILVNEKTATLENIATGMKLRFINSPTGAVKLDALEEKEKTGAR